MNKIISKAENHREVGNKFVLWHDNIAKRFYEQHPNWSGRRLSRLTAIMYAPKPSWKTTFSAYSHHVCTQTVVEDDFLGLQPTRYAWLQM